MTAVAKLPAAIRALAEVIRKHGTCPPAALDHVADELEASLSPAELGGVENPDRYALRMLVAAGWVSESKANEALNIAHGFAKEPLSTPRAAEAVTVDQATIDRAVGSCIRSKGRYSAYHAPETDDEWRAALTAALTPPSAKGE